MGSNLVIVAVPADDDPIWKVSSEKKPHLTLLFLGDAASNPNTQRIISFVEHAVTVCQHGSFYADVDYRDTLGPDEADVYMLRKDWGLKWIAQFRNQLLQNTDIKSAFESTDQYPEWTPHITLGYPETPANNDKMPEYGISMVRFDRIAVWTGDYEGPEFRLEWPERMSDLEVAYADMGKDAIADLLEHHGVKGMKWGVVRSNIRTQRIARLRKEGDALNSAADKARGGTRAHALRAKAARNHKEADALEKAAAKRAAKQAAKTPVTTRTGKTKLVSPRKASRMERRFRQNAETLNTFIKIHNKAAETSNAHDIERINNKPEYKNKDFTKPSPLRDKYYKEHADAFNKRLEEAATSMKSPTGAKQYDVHIHEDGRWEVFVRDVKHAAGDPSSFVVKIAYDADGYITKIEPQDPSSDSLAQTALYGEVFVDGLVDGTLVHYGVRGMHWGVRREPPTAAHPKAESHVPHGGNKQTKISVKGGENHPAHPDALKVAEARVKLAKSGPSALSNKELRDVANRVKLEQEVKQLTTHGGEKFVKNLIKTQTQQGAHQFVGKHVRKALRV